MIRIFIAALLYLISFFTQAQTDPNDKKGKLKIEVEQVIVESAYKKDVVSDFSPGHFEGLSNQEAKFEVMDKDLTFEINILIKQP